MLLIFIVYSYTPQEKNVLKVSSGDKGKKTYSSFFIDITI